MRGISLGGVRAPFRNPYFDEALRYDPLVRSRTISTRWTIPDRHDLSSVISRHEGRDKLTRSYAFAIPNEAAVAAIAARGPVVEIGAGTGYWASLLAQAGADVVAYDVAPGKNGYVDVKACYHEIRVGDAEAARAHPDRTLFLCWPPMTDMAERALRAYTGRCVAFVGEGAGGCTGSDGFFDLLDREWMSVETVDIPEW